MAKTKTRTKVVPIPVPVRAPMARMPMGAPRINAVPPQASPVPGVPPVGIGGPGGAMKHGGKVHKHASGGKMKSMKETMGPKTMSKDVEKGSNKLTKFGESAVQKRGHTKGKNLGDSGKTMKPKMMAKGCGYASGGKVKMKETMGPRTMSQDVEKGSNKLTKFGESAVQKRGHTKGKNLGDSGPSIGIEGGGMKKGGKVKKMARGGGIEVRGKTKGKMC